MEKVTNNEVVDTEIISVDGEQIPVFEGMGEAEARAVKPILQDFVKSFTEKPKEVSTEAWLTQKLAAELPEQTPEEIAAMSHEIVSSVATFDENLASVNKACAEGQTKEEWFVSKIREHYSAKRMEVTADEYGNYIANIDRAFFQSNKQMMRVIHTKNGEVSKNFNLDGFIAEQQHVNDFNAQAALEGAEEFTAYVKGPGKEGYNKNSFDIVIKDSSGHIVHQYQSKYGKDAAATIRMLKKGNYDNQQILVPAEQVEEVQKAFPNKTVTAHIGGTSKVSTKSKALTKAEVKRRQLDAQEKHLIKAKGWDTQSMETVAVNLAQNAALAGYTSAKYAVGFHIAKKVWDGEKIDANEVVEVALTTGADAGIKHATAGALTVAVRRGLIPMLAKSTPAGIIANIASVGIENAKILFDYARGKISGLEAVDSMGRVNVSMTAGLVAMGKGASIGASIGSVVPVVGTAIGGFIGGTIGYIAGSKVGEKIYSGVKKVAKVAKEVVTTAYEGVKAVGSAVCDLASSAVKTAGEVIGSAVKAAGDLVSSGIKAIGNFLFG